MPRTLPFLLLLALAACTVSQPTAQSSDKVFEEAYPFAPGDGLSVTTSSTDLTLRVGSGSEARVEVFGKGKDIEESFRRLGFRVEREGSRLVVKTDPEGGSWWNGKRASFEIVVTAPKRLNLSVATSSGDVAFRQLEGNVEVSTSSGDIEIGTVRGALSASTSSGDIEAERLEGNVEVSTSSGDLEVGAVRGAAVSFSTSSGDFSAERLDADRLSLSSSSGDVEIDALSGATEISTSSGDVSLGAVEGDLAVSASSGDLRANLTKPGAVDLNTGSGGVRLWAPASLSADLEVRGGSVRIDRAFGFAGEVRDESAYGRLGDGGARLHVRTGGGSVSLTVR